MNKSIIFLLVLIFIVIFAIFKTPQPKDSTPEVPTRHIKLGAWTEGLFDSSTQQLHPEKLLQFEELIQKKLSIAHYYRGWEALADPNLITELATLQNQGWEPMINVNPYYFSECPVTELPLYKAIAEGKCDDFLHRAGKNLSHVKQPFYLLFAWEMNNPEHEWSIKYTGSSANDFVQAWQHIYTIFKQEKATDILWVFCPNVPDDKSVPYDKIYPGSDYVDWIGLDGYNWGTTQSWSQWLSFSEIFKGAYDKILSIAPDKPMVIAEVNTTDQGGDKGGWYTDMFTQQIPYNFSKIEAVVVFNEDRSSQEHVNWKIDVTPLALQAFISAIHTPFYK